MALNCSSEFKGFIVQFVCVVETQFEFVCAVRAGSKLSQQLNFFTKFRSLATAYLLFLRISETNFCLGMGSEVFRVELLINA